MPRRQLGPPAAQALLVFVFSLLVTGTLVAGVALGIERQDRLAFDYEVERTRDAIEQRIAVTANLLRGTAGLFEASHDVSATEFRRYIGTLQLPTRYPGILGIGFARWLEPSDVVGFEAEVRAQGQPDFHVWPAGARPAMSSIVYLEPLDRRNAAAIGFDMLTEPTRRAAMLAARGSGTLVASGKVTLVQEIDPAKQAGFLLYLPVYAYGDDDAPSRFLGFVYAPLRTGDLLAGTRGPGVSRIDYTLYDGDRANAAALLRNTAQAGDPTGRLTAERHLSVGGRPWLVRFYSRPALDALSQRWLVPWLALAAFVASALLASLSWLQGRARERAEAAVVATREAVGTLNRERAWLGATLTSIADGVIAVDADERITWMNPVAERLTGWTRNAAIGQPLAVVADILRDDAAALRDGQAMLRARDGSLHPVDHNRAPIRDAEGEASGAVVVMHDASDRHRTEAELRDNDRRKDEFLAMLAHELRNPLAPISTAATLLRMPQLDAVRVEHASAVILRQVGHMTELVDDLLDVSRVTRGLVELEREVFDVREAVRAAAEQAYALIERQRHSLELDLGDTPLPVDGDRTRLMQVVANLLNNAAKYTAPGGHIRVEARGVGDDVRLRVSDDGIGMPPELLPRVFELFTQAERTPDRSEGGLGLGLALVKSIVALHHGRITAASAGPGMGAAFTVSLPLAHAGPAAARPLRILLVDGEDGGAGSADGAELCTLLAADGHAVAPCPDGPCALARAGELHPDAVLIRTDLPGVDGYALARQLRARDPDNRAVYIALSTSSQSHDRVIARGAGFDHQLEWPVAPAALRKILPPTVS
jgi:PAS domain S-box-containing protein